MSPCRTPPAVCARAATTVAALALATAAPAQAGADPMRPLVLPTAGTAAAAGASAPALAPPPAGARAAAAALPPLVAIRQDSTGQRLALLGEQWVRRGDRLPGGRQVLAIDEHQVQIGGGPEARPQVLALLPVLQPADPPPAAARPAEPGRPSRRTSPNPP